MDGVAGGNAATDAAGVLAADTLAEGGAEMAGIENPPADGAVELGGAGAPSGGIANPPARLGGVEAVDGLAAAVEGVPNMVGGVEAGAAASCAAGCAVFTGCAATAGD